MSPGGQEHRVLDAAPHYVKATYPGQYGFTVVAGPAYPGLSPALPLEYLERLELGNECFGDDWRLEGVGREEGRLVVFTSQTTVVGEAACPDEIIAFMEKRRLALLDGVALGHPGALSFYRDLDALAVFDAHPANVLKDDNGVILPIDLILVKADEALAAQLEAARG
jgi:hypothetical protein